MDQSDPDSLLRRIRWPNVSRLAILVLLALVAGVVPRLDAHEPTVPTGVAVPVRGPDPVIAPVADPQPSPRRPHPQHASKRPRRPRRRHRHAPKPKTRAKRPASPVRFTPAPIATPPATEFNPAQDEFGR